MKPVTPPVLTVRKTATPFALGRQRGMTDLFFRIPQKSRTSLSLTALLFSWALPGCTIEAYEPSAADEASEEYTAASDSDDESTSSSSVDDRATDDESSGSDEESEAGPSVIPFDQLVQQTVPWFDVDVTVESAETRRATVASFSGNVLKSGHFVTLTVQNRTRFATELGYQHWDLILADGTRVAGETERLDFGPRDALSRELFFYDDSGQTLEGAHLELNGSEYGEFRPLNIPLDALVDAEPVLELPEVVGQVIAAEPAEDAPWQHEILFARVSYNSDGYNGEERARAEYGKKLLDLVVRSTNLNGSSLNLFDERYHLNVNGVGVSTQSSINELPEVGEPVEVPIVFQIDEDVTEFDIELNIGPESPPIWSTIHVNLADAVPAE